MDRGIVYPGAIPLDTDVLRANQNAMIAAGYGLQTMLGTSVVVDGLACTPGSGLTVQIGAGSITQYVALENTAFGSLPADTSDSLVKQGINISPVTTATLTAPATVGQSINYLIEAQLLEADTGATVLPYYNASNPSVAYSGPSNSGTAQNTLRTQRVSLQVKAGTAATTGSQVTPSVDSGWTGLYIVTVPNGSVSFTTASIVPYPGAPFLPAKLPQLRQILTANLDLYVNPTTGNDSFSGMAPWNAFATMTGAYNFIIQHLDMSGFQVSVHLSASTHTIGLVASGIPQGYNGNNPVVFNCLTASATVSVTNSNCINASNGAPIRIGANMILTATGTYPSTGNGILSQLGASVTYGGCTFGACGGSHIVGAQSGVASAFANYTVSGAGLYHYSASAGQVFDVGVTVTLSGTPAFSGAFASASFTGVISVTSATFAGTAATGSRYIAQSNGVINTNAAGATYFPGNAAGTTATGGQYI